MPPKLTLQVRFVLAAFLKDPDAELFGRQVCQMTDLPPGTVFPILTRLERAGWLVSRWEDPAERIICRQVRHYYRLTSDGWTIARQEAWAGSLT